MSAIHQHKLANGAWLVAEPVPGAQSLAMTMLLPAGVAQEPANHQGAAAMLAEMIMRGAGPLDARAHSDALDQLGVQRGTNVEIHHLSLSAMMLGDKLADALPLLLDMVRRPMLPVGALEPSRDLALQAIAGLEDEPQHKVFDRLRQRHYPMPFGRSTLGQADHLKAITLDQIKQYWRWVFVPQGAVLSFAGKFDWTELRERVERQLGDWRGKVEAPTEQAPPPRGYLHEEAKSTQVHIGVAYDAEPETNPSSMVRRAAVAVLAGGMSGRLFTEVREKRGLCYAVSATYAASRQRGAVLSYAGTTTARAQETLDVLVAEHRRLSEGVEEDEFQRAIVGMKSRLVMQGESTGARSRAIAADQFIFGRPRTLEEVAAEVDAVTLKAVRGFVHDHPPGPLTIVTVGPEALKA